MSEMIERLAHAMVDALKRQEDEDPANAAHIQDTALDLVGIQGNVDMLKVARAVLEAMQEPTDDMVQHPSYIDGEWSRRTWEASMRAALPTPPKE